MTYGFITIVEVPELGYSGGLLILRADGKPVEFHCTAPVAENRAQKILYGSTYQTFVFCDQIGNALIRKPQSCPQFLITDKLELLSLPESDNKLALESVIHLADTNEVRSQDAPPQLSASQRFSISDHTLTVSTPDLEACQSAKEACRQFAANLPLDEPFERIRQAIDEAQAVAR